jgi:hypothetical protein
MSSVGQVLFAFCHAISVFIAERWCAATMFASVPSFGKTLAALGKYFNPHCSARRKTVSSSEVMLVALAAEFLSEAILAAVAIYRSDLSPSILVILPAESVGHLLKAEVVRMRAVHQAVTRGRALKFRAVPRRRVLRQEVWRCACFIQSSSSLVSEHPQAMFSISPGSGAHRGRTVRNSLAIAKARSALAEVRREKATRSYLHRPASRR